jgi:hypothetical protein
MQSRQKTDPTLLRYSLESDAVSPRTFQIEPEIRSSDFHITLSKIKTSSSYSRFGKPAGWKMMMKNGCIVYLGRRLPMNRA